MYLTTYGGSAIIHVLAAHPKLVAVLGIAAAVAALSTPLGPGDYSGQSRYAAQIERRLPADPDDAGIVRDAQQRASTLSELPKEQLRLIVGDTLRECGSNCVGLTTDSVTDDPSLMRTVLFVHELAAPTGAGVAATPGSTPGLRGSSQ